jgi:hypothetical protein
VPTLLEGGIRRQRGLDALEKYNIVLARLGRAAEWHRPLDHVRVADGPLVGLPGTHRPAGHERKRLDPERGHELMLLLDLIWRVPTE